MQIESTDFYNSQSLGSGGAISAAGATVIIRTARFINCSSEGDGGGAIAATDFFCYGSTKAINTTIKIVDSLFNRCVSRGSGGAILVTSTSATLSIFGSEFTACQSKKSGGALAALDGGTATATNSIFSGNIAHGYGGGALYARNAQLTLHGVSARKNLATEGGGGALYWTGQKPPSVIPWCMQGTYPDHTFVCSPRNCTESCLPCVKGTYQSGIGMSSQEGCLPCAAGTFSSAPGTTSCSMCHVGYYSTFQGASYSSTCAECLPGSYSNVPASTSCLQCKAGTFMSNYGATICSMCQAGLYLELSGVSQLDACKECSAGFFAQYPDSSECLQCNPGFYSGPKATACEACPPGLFASEARSSQCFLCVPGRYSDAGASACASCESGKYSSSSGATDSIMCTSCSPGLFSGPGAARCASLSDFRVVNGSSLFSYGQLQNTVSLPFPFQFYCQKYSETTLSVHGVLGFGNCSLDSNNLFLPSVLNPNSEIVAIFWQSLAANNRSSIIQWSDNDAISFQWTDWATLYWAGSLTFQVSLLRNGSVLLSYIELDGIMSLGQLATVGIQGGTLGWTISFYEDKLYPGLCYHLLPDPQDCSIYRIEQYTCPYNIRLVATCGPGLYLGSDFKCTACPVGSYQTGMKNSGSCVLCEAGKYSNQTGATASEDCLAYTEANNQVGDINASEANILMYEEAGLDVSIKNPVSGHKASVVVNSYPALKYNLHLFPQRCIFIHTHSCCHCPS